MKQPMVAHLHATLKFLLSEFIMHEISFSPFLIIRLPIVNKELEFGTKSGDLRSFLMQHVQNAKDEISR